MLVSGNTLLSPNFFLSEFVKETDLPLLPVEVLLRLSRIANEILEPLRYAWGAKPVRITSGWRPKGRKESQHCNGGAIDCVPEGLSLDAAMSIAAQECKVMPVRQLIIGPPNENHLHIGLDEQKPPRRELLREYNDGSFKPWVG